MHDAREAEVDAQLKAESEAQDAAALATLVDAHEVGSPQPEGTEGEEEEEQEEEDECVG